MLAWSQNSALQVCFGHLIRTAHELPLFVSTEVELDFSGVPWLGFVQLFTGLALGSTTLETQNAF